MGGPPGGQRRLLRLQRVAATLSRHRAGSLMLCDGPCAALDVAPPDEPPERTSGTFEVSRALRQWGSEGLRAHRFRVRRGDLHEGSCSGTEDSPLGAPTSDPRTISPAAQDPSPKTQDGSATGVNRWYRAFRAARTRLRRAWCHGGGCATAGPGTGRWAPPLRLPACTRRSPAPGRC